VPQAPFADFTAANQEAAAWCAEVNGVVHSEICAVPAERLVTERELLGPLPSLRASIGKMTTRKVDKLSCVRFASARYSVPVRLIGAEVKLRADGGRLLVITTGAGEVVAEHTLVAPGEASVRDEHYGGPRPDTPRRAVRPKTAAEREFCALGPVAGAFITGAAASGSRYSGPWNPRGGSARFWCSPCAASARTSALAGLPWRRMTFRRRRYGPAATS
jgi:hypothetical protein